MELNQLELTGDKIPEIIASIKKDSDMPELPLSEQKELWNRITVHNKHHDQRFVKLMIWSGSIAASICLLIIAGWYLLSSPPPQPVVADYQSIMQSFVSTEEVSDNVQLVLSNNQKIHIEGQEAHIDYDEEGRVSINKNKQLEIDKAPKDEKVAYNQIIVPAGRRSMLTLSDGTKVWINCGSKLVYPVAFEKQKREIFVEGEIYLDVTPDADRPFFVHTGVLDVKVLGTQFDVSAYRDQPDLLVVLVNGEVEVQNKDLSNEILKPNQMFTYNDETKNSSVSVVDVSDYIAWKDGYYPFNSQDLGTVLTKLAKYYNVQIKWNEKLKELICSGKLDLKGNVQEVLNALEKSAPIEIRKITEREYTVIVKP